MAKRRSFSYALLGSVRNKISTPLPFSVHAMGHAMRFFPYMEDLPAREDPFVELYWCISGSGKFYLEDGSEEIMRPGDVFYRLESERHYHEIVEEPWEYRWLTFAGPLAEALLKSYCFHILALLIRHFVSPDMGESRKLALKRADNLKLALDYVNGHFREEISLAKAASAACMSPSYFSSSVPSLLSKNHIAALHIDLQLCLGS